MIKPRQSKCGLGLLFELEVSVVVWKKEREVKCRQKNQGYKKAFVYSCGLGEK